ncbi:MAG: hypothetical protein ABWY05_04330 [Noviherbaspirillum sp.]
MWTGGPGVASRTARQYALLEAVPDEVLQMIARNLDLPGFTSLSSASSHLRAALSDPFPLYRRGPAAGSSASWFKLYQRKHCPEFAEQLGNRFEVIDLKATGEHLLTLAASLAKARAWRRIRLEITSRTELLALPSLLQKIDEGAGPRAWELELEINGSVQPLLLQQALEGMSAFSSVELTCLSIWNDNAQAPLASMLACAPHLRKLKCGIFYSRKKLAWITDALVACQHSLSKLVLRDLVDADMTALIAQAKRLGVRELTLQSPQAVALDSWSDAGLSSFTLRYGLEKAHASRLQAALAKSSTLQRLKIDATNEALKDPERLINGLNHNISLTSLTVDCFFHRDEEDYAMATLVEAVFMHPRLRQVNLRIPREFVDVVGRMMRLRPDLEFIWQECGHDGLYHLEGVCEAMEAAQNAAPPAPNI